MCTSAALRRFTDSNLVMPFETSAQPLRLHAPHCLFFESIAC
ncbi:hypothetical protein BSU04_04425 [Caballeronia sordidicola]|uniref:Uncharacterized protein n=1 Tax=Caballeronia sordidicola TaxID=196367 RepID=A0A226X9Q9_CABSO|nr:hypothetical protein BSU04_04425 [Caballeronia sordidicola]